MSGRLRAAMLALGVVGAGWASAAAGQTSFPTRAATVRVGGQVLMVCDASGANCAPASAANPLPVTGGTGGGGSSGPATFGTNVDAAALPASTTQSALVGCRYLATPPAWSDGWTGAVRCTAAGAQVSTLEGPLPAGTNAIGTVSLPTGYFNSPNAGLTLGLLSNLFTVRAVCSVGLPSSAVCQGDNGNQYVVAVPSTTSTAGVAPGTVANAASQVAKANPGNMYGLNVDNAAVTGTYAILYNATAAPAAGASLTATNILWHFLLGSGASLDKSWPVPAYCSVGCTVLYSTSLTTFTAPATAPLASTAMAK